MANVSIHQQLKCAERELKMRQSAYPRWVASSKMNQQKADREIEAMSAIVETLQALSDREAKLQTRLF